jgi:hypothetical protein
MSAIIFNGPLLRALKAAIRFNDQATIWSGSADPTVTPTFGRQGDIYIKFGASPAFYQKVTADGTDVNWTQGAPIAPNAISGAEIRLDNDESLRARNAANNGDVNILKVNASDRILFASLPQVASDPIAGDDLARLSYISTQLGLKISSTEKGANNGVATLDAGGKVPVSQLPSSVMTYEGTWNASTNTPTLADGTGDAGQIYLVDTAGTQNLGSGNITFAIGDWAVHNGTIWQKSLNSNAVVSVNSQTGVVTLVTDDIAEDGSPTNLWFTDERAQDAVGGVLANTTTINLSYNDGTPSISGVINADSLTNTHINTAAAIAYSKLNLASSIVNNDIAAAAGIAVSKLAALTASRAVASDASGFLVAASTTAAELDFVSGVTSAIQTQLNGKEPTITTLPINKGGTGETSATAAFDALAPTTTIGDISYHNGTDNVRLAGNSTSLQKFLSSVGTGSSAQAPTWSDLPVAGNFIFVMANAASSVGGYYQMVSLSAYTPAALASVSQTVTTSPTLLASFATNVGFPNATTIPSGILTVHYETQKASGNNNYYTYFELYKRSAGGTETLLLTSDNSSQLNVNTIIQQTVTALISSAIVTLATDRLVVKVYAQMVTGSASVAIRFDDSTDARAILPALAADVTNFVPYTGAVSNVDLGSNSITASNFSGSSSGTNTGDQTITLSGDVTGSGTSGITASIAASVVTGKLITGFVSGAGTVAATDTILQAINKLDGNIAGKEPTITVLSMDKGGTNKNMTASAGAVAYSDADSLELTAVGTSGQVLQSNGASAPSWITLSAAIPTIFGTRASPRSIVAATGITSGASHMSASATAQDIYIEGSITGDSVSATITAGTTDGQRMTLLGRSDTNTVTLNSTTTNVALNGPITLGDGDVINLRFDGTNWQETSRS